MYQLRWTQELGKGHCKGFRIPQHRDGKETDRHVKLASPWLAELPSVGKHDAENEKQPWLSVWTILEQAGPFLLRVNALSKNVLNTVAGDQ